MKQTERQITVLITGAGGVVAPTLIRHLRFVRGYRVIAVDANPHAYGLTVADKGFVVPMGDSEHFVPVMRSICQEEHVDVAVPMVDEELLPSLGLTSETTQVLLPTLDFVELCLDKFLLFQKLRGVVEIPITKFGRDYESFSKFPAVLKPRTGRGSRGVYRVNDVYDLEFYVKRSDHGKSGLIVQQYIHGDEYTVSVVVGRDGDVQAVVPKRVIYKRGVTHSAVTEKSEPIDELCRVIQSELHADGPFNVQLRVDAETGTPIPFEINPRFSTTTSLTIRSGVDEVGGLIRQLVDPSAPKLNNSWTAGMVLTRYTVDDIGLLSGATHGEIHDYRSIDIL
jgi:carbamoyl-phosphate synthase large subunit